MVGDFYFDERVARLYNLQRAHPPHVSTRIGEAVRHQVGPHASILEVGGGTGRISLPVAASGSRVFVMDLAGQMLSQISPAGDLFVAQADMHHQPFPSNAFDAVMAVHVLHLARDWQAVLAEIARVLRSDGVFIQGRDWVDPESVIGKMRWELRRYVMETAPSIRPPAMQVSREDVIKQLGGTITQRAIVADWTIQASPAEWLHIVEQRLDPESWVLDDETFERVYDHLAAYAQETWPDLEAQQTVNRQFLFSFTRGSW
ncbi:MAG: class I SAM-dependent methyltransferase [Anaerolineae bacterium]